MIIIKKLGIWMDHASAHIMQLKEGMTTHTINSTSTREEREKSLQKSEHLMHNKEQQQQCLYYQQLGDTIKKYDDVLLFGPTDAKLELLNSLKGDHSFSNIKIVTKSSEKMTEKQEHAFVRSHFSKPRRALL